MYVCTRNTPKAPRGPRLPNRKMRGKKRKGDAKDDVDQRHAKQPKTASDQDAKAAAWSVKLTTKDHRPGDKDEKERILK